MSSIPVYPTIDTYIEDENSPFIPATIDGGGDNPLTIPDGCRGIRIIATTAAVTDFIEITRTEVKGAGMPIGAGVTILLFDKPSENEALWIQRRSGVNPSLPFHIGYF